MNTPSNTTLFVTSLAAAVLAVGLVTLPNPARADDGRVRGSITIRGGSSVIGTAHPRGRIHPRVYIAPPLLFAPFFFDYRYPYSAYPYGYPYPYPYPYPYGYPYGYPYPGDAPGPAQPPAYVERAPDTEPAPPAAQTPPAGYWYWCNDPRGYYPTVRECPQGWLQVTPQPPEQPRPTR